MNRVVLILAALHLTGCVNVLPKATPAAVRYTISPVAFDDASSTPKVDWSLAVADPTATRAYDTAKIALTRSPGQIEYYAQGEWADRGPTLVRTALIRSFENSGRILGVGDTVTLPGADFVLKTDIRTLHVQYGDRRPDAVVEVFAKITDRRGRIIASRLFQERATTDRDSVPAIGRAFDTSVSNALTDIIEWSFETADADAGQAK